MSGLEVVAAVAAIVSGFGSGVNLFRQWKAKRARRREARLAHQEKTEEALNTSGPLVRREYDEDSQRLGNTFAIGDQVGRAELLYLITLQRSIISLLRGALDGRSTDLSLSQLLQMSNSVRTGSIDALSNQYQRMSTAASFTRSQISNTMSVSAERDYRSLQYCSFALRMHHSNEELLPHDEECPDCPWDSTLYVPSSHSDLIRITRSRRDGLWYDVYTFSMGERSRSKIQIPRIFFLKCHLQSTPQRSGGQEQPLFGCFFCEGNGKLRNFSDWWDFARHILWNHWDDYWQDHDSV